MPKIHLRPFILYYATVVNEFSREFKSIAVIGVGGIGSFEIRKESVNLDLHTVILSQSVVL